MSSFTKNIQQFLSKVKALSQNSVCNSAMLFVFNSFTGDRLSNQIPKEDDFENRKMSPRHKRE
jgi:hypothetical protein